ncbi:MAG TPA: N-acetylneuraminate synthase, partial [Sulfurimonas autotrophica]|nr:N-acetylneuraminate synthase [Sulfurimonas autotrophica]
MHKNKVFIIAEAGVNHNGSIELAKKLIDVATEAGADAVKFQTFKADCLVSKEAQKADYQKETTCANESQYEMIKKLELDVRTHKELMAYCEQKGIMFLSTPFDHDSIELLNDLGLEIFKIPSGEITNLPYLRHIGSLKKRVILSTGMADIGEIEDAIDVLTNAGTLREDITILHANTMYPTP